VAEEMVFGDITTGPSNDLQVATNLARAMVTRWGMSSEIGPIALESDDGRTMFGQGVNDKEYSERVSALIDSEVAKIMNNSFVIAKKILTDKRKVLDIIAGRLIEVETLEQKDYNDLIIANGILPKKKNVEK
jgi:cell division protease FtsH